MAPPALQRDMTSEGLILHRQLQPGLELASPPRDDYKSEAGWSSSAHVPAHQPADGKPEEEKTICGLRRATFVLSVLLATVIVVAAVGAGVGASVAVRNAKSPAANSTNSSPVTTTVTVSSAPTSTASASALITVPTSGVLAFNCSSLDTTQSITINGATWTYNLHCGDDYTGQRIDLAAPTVYSFNDCLKACSTYSLFTQNSTGCVGVAFNANLTNFVPRFYGNCFLKTYLGQLSTESPPDPNQVAAALIASPA